MQNYLYDNSLNIYFSFKGRNSHVPTLNPSNLNICILGKSYSLMTSTATRDNEDSIQGTDPRITESSISKFSKSDPPHVKKQQKQEEELEDLEEEKKEVGGSHGERKDIQNEPKSERNLCCENPKKKKKKSQKGFWGSMMSWSRKSNSDAAKIQEKFVKNRIKVNKLIDNHVFEIAWFTYRKGFHGSFYENLKTDSGWGCMVRSGQMLVFTVLKRLLKNKMPTFYIISKKGGSVTARELFHREVA
jgi:hypothetical protein